MRIEIGEGPDGKRRSELGQGLGSVAAFKLYNGQYRGLGYLIELFEGGFSRRAGADLLKPTESG
jgi:hypothetical protein